MEPTPVKGKSHAYFQSLPPGDLRRAADTTWRVCAIWELLKEGSWTSQEIADILKMEPSAIKNHLKRFRLAGLAEVYFLASILGHQH